MTIMFDSVNIHNIPANASMVAGYVNGHWATYESLKAAFPKAHVVSIDVFGNAVADVIDVEKGDATPQVAVAWAAHMRTLGRNPIVYASRALIPTIIHTFQTSKQPLPFFWVADYTGVSHVCTEFPNVVATQWADGTPTYPGAAKFCDTSTVLNTWPINPPVK